MRASSFSTLLSVAWAALASEGSSCVCVCVWCVWRVRAGVGVDETGTVG
jgi:hypothetical protein